MPTLSETYKGWKESGMSGRGNTDAMIHAIVEELLKHEKPKAEERPSFFKEEQVPIEKPKKK